MGKQSKQLKRTQPMSVDDCKKYVVIFLACISACFFGYHRINHHMLGSNDLYSYIEFASNITQMYTRTEVPHVDVEEIEMIWRRFHPVELRSHVSGMISILSNMLHVPLAQYGRQDLLPLNRAICNTEGEDCSRSSNSGCEMEQRAPSNPLKRKADGVERDGGEISPCERSLSPEAGADENGQIGREVKRSRSPSKEASSQSGQSISQLMQDDPPVRHEACDDSTRNDVLTNSRLVRHQATSIDMRRPLATNNSDEQQVVRPKERKKSTTSKQARPTHGRQMSQLGFQHHDFFDPPVRHEACDDSTRNDVLSNSRLVRHQATSNDTRRPLATNNSDEQQVVRPKERKKSTTSKQERPTHGRQMSQLGFQHHDFFDTPVIHEARDNATPNDVLTNSRLVRHHATSNDTRRPLATNNSDEKRAVRPKERKKPSTSKHSRSIRPRQASQGHCLTATHQSRIQCGNTSSGSKSEESDSEVLGAAGYTRSYSRHSNIQHHGLPSNTNVFQPHSRGTYSVTRQSHLQNAPFYNRLERGGMRGIAGVGAEGFDWDQFDNPPYDDDLGYQSDDEEGDEPTCIVTHPEDENPVIREAAMRSGCEMNFATSIYHRLFEERNRLCSVGSLTREIENDLAEPPPAQCSRQQNEENCPSQGSVTGSEVSDELSEEYPSDVSDATETDYSAKEEKNSVGTVRVFARATRDSDPDGGLSDAFSVLDMSDCLASASDCPHNEPNVQDDIFSFSLSSGEPVALHTDDAASNDDAAHDLTLVRADGDMDAYATYFDGIFGDSGSLATGANSAAIEFSDLDVSDYLASASNYPRSVPIVQDYIFSFSLSSGEPVALHTDALHTDDAASNDDAAHDLTLVRADGDMDAYATYFDGSVGNSGSLATSANSAAIESDYLHVTSALELGGLNDSSTGSNEAAMDVDGLNSNVTARKDDHGCT